MLARAETAIAGRSRLAGLTRRLAEPAAKAPGEVRDVVETDGVGDFGDAAACEARAEQERARPLQSLLAHELRDARALALEQHADIARAHPMPRGDLAERDLRLEMGKQVVLDRLQATGANTAAL